MKKNILGALVIVFVTIVLFLMIDDISKSKNPEYQVNSVEAYEANQQPELATSDIEEEKD